MESAKEGVPVLEVVLVAVEQMESAKEREPVVGGGADGGADGVCQGGGTCC